MKRFFYFSGGLLCLALTALIAFHLGQGTAKADYDSYAPGQIVGAGDKNGPAVLSRSGEIWTILPSWQRIDPGPLPVASSSVKFFTGDMLVTSSDEVFIWFNNTDRWESQGFFPGSPITIQPDTWTGIKTREYRSGN